MSYLFLSLILALVVLVAVLHRPTLQRKARVLRVRVLSWLQRAPMRYARVPLSQAGALAATTYAGSGVQPMPIPIGSEVVAVRLAYTPTANPTANDTVHIGVLPVGCVPVDCILDAPDMDTNGTPTITISAGVLNANKDDLSATWIAAANIGQAGGMARPTENTLVRTAGSSSVANIGLKFPAAAATFASGEIGLTVLYRNTHYGK